LKTPLQEATHLYFLILNSLVSVAGSGGLSGGLLLQHFNASNCSRMFAQLMAKAGQRVAKYKLRAEDRDRGSTR